MLDSVGLAHVLKSYRQEVSSESKEKFSLSACRDNLRKLNKFKFDFKSKEEQELRTKSRILVHCDKIVRTQACYLRDFRQNKL